MDYSVPGVLGGLGQGYSDPNMMYFGSLYNPISHESLEGIDRFKDTIAQLLYGVLHTVGGKKEDRETFKSAIRHFLDIPANLLILAQLLGIEISTIVGNDIRQLYMYIINSLEQKMKFRFGRRRKKAH